MRPNPPVIVIGMHRSGTSMLTRVLQRSGFFMGRGTTRNEECRWTNAVNYWLFGQASATWERPEGMDTVLASAPWREVVTDYLGGITDGPASLGYLGVRRWARYRSMHRVTAPWGWKDPRNTFTLPLWRSVFPHARVLHIMRHGVDVAHSLQVRHLEARDNARRRYQRHRTWYVNNPLAPKRSGFAHAMRVADLDGGLELWRGYTRRARGHVEALGDQALEVRYEDLLREPEHHLAEILAFCGLGTPVGRVRDEARNFRPERAFAYRESTSLRAFAEARESTLREHGYAP